MAIAKPLCRTSELNGSICVILRGRCESALSAPGSTSRVLERRLTQGRAPLRLNVYLTSAQCLQQNRYCLVFCVCVSLLSLIHLLFLFLFPADATTAPSVQWWPGLTCSLTPALARTSTWRSSMSAFHTVSSSLTHSLGFFIHGSLHGPCLKFIEYYYCDRLLPSIFCNANAILFILFCYLLACYCVSRS